MLKTVVLPLLGGVVIAGIIGGFIGLTASVATDVYKSQKEKRANKAKVVTVK